MKLYLFEYVTPTKDGFKTVWIPGNNPEDAQQKATKKNVVCNAQGPIIVKVDSKELNQDWK